MGRVVKPRDNYRNDAVVINRLIGALELDASADGVWREEVVGHLAKAMTLLLQPKRIKSPKPVRST